MAKVGAKLGAKNKRHIPKELDKRKNNHQPEKFVDLEKVKELCSIGCTMREVESVMRLSHDTIERRIIQETGGGWKLFFKNHASEFKMSLRRLQMRSAEGDYDIDNKKYSVLPSVAMQIWLGKQFLEQKDKHETVIEDKTNIPQFEWADAVDVTNQKQLDNGEEEEDGEADSDEGVASDDE